MRNGELGCSVYTHEEKELSLTRLHLRNVNVEEADQIALELLQLGFVALYVWQTRDGMSLRGTGAVRIGSDEGQMAARHKSSRPMAAA